MLPDPEVGPSVGRREVEAFANASGDLNPIHLSADAARAAGLEGPVLHGMYIAGRFEIFLERLQGLHVRELNVRFIRPAPVGSSITVSARHLGAAGSRLRLRLLATITEGPLVAVGEALLEGPSDPAEQELSLIHI